MKKCMKAIVILLSALLLMGCSATCCSAAEKTTEFEPFYRFDVDSPTAWKEPLSGLRFLTEGEYSLTPFSEDKIEKYGLAPDTMPDEKGMGTNQQFPILTQEQRKRLDGKVKYEVWERLDDGRTVTRFASSWATPMEHVQQLANLL